MKSRYLLFLGLYWNRDRALALNALSVKMGIDAAFGKPSHDFFDAIAKNEKDINFLKQLHEASVRENEAMKR